MLRRFILKESKPGGTELILPVTPSSWQGERGRKANSLIMHSAGAVNLPGSRVLLDEELDCLLPATDYAFTTPGAVTDPWYYIRQLTQWSEDGTVLRFIVSGTDVNEAVILDPIRYREQDGTNDVYCTIPLRGYLDLKAVTVELAAADNKARADGDGPQTEVTYTVVAGDTLSAIAKRFYGDASLYGKLAAANGIKNANLIYPGQVLKIPDAKALPAAAVSTTGGVSSGDKKRDTIKITVTYTGSSAANVGSAWAEYSRPEGLPGTKTLSDKVMFSVDAGAVVKITWKNNGKGDIDYCVANGKTIKSSGGVFTLYTAFTDVALYIHWMKVK